MAQDHKVEIRLAVDLDQSMDQLIDYDPAAGGGPSGDALLLETGTDYILLESGDFLLLE